VREALDGRDGFAIGFDARLRRPRQAELHCRDLTRVQPTALGCGERRQTQRDARLGHNLGERPTMRRRRLDPVETVDVECPVCPAFAH
jgi:hypothetical protein